jgi:hypothetical protein
MYSTHARRLACNVIWAWVMDDVSWQDRANTLACETPFHYTADRLKSRTDPMVVDHENALTLKTGDFNDTTGYLSAATGRSPS